jgi:peptidoglycan/LPS O-acetylase OafA/YrhL
LRHNDADLLGRGVDLVTQSLWAAPRIADLAAGRDNNFNLLRIIAALAVLISHTALITQGPDAVELLSAQLDGITLGTLSVMMFFSISGFFITRSFAGRRSVTGFIVARCLRLFPALIVVTALTILVSWFWLTTAPAGIFWPEAGNFFIRNITLFSLSYDLPGVFVDNIYGTTINSSLWTLNYEVMCYMGVAVCGLLGLSRPRYFFFVLLVFLVIYRVNMVYTLIPRLSNLITLGLPFAIGMSFWVWRKYIPLSVPLALILLVATFFCHDTPLFRPALVLALSYTTFVIGYAKIPVLAAYNRAGDYSYGTYVYAFPIQQMLASFGVVTPLANMALALPLTLICAVVSWHLVEGPAMRLKGKTAQLKPTSA